MSSFCAWIFYFIWGGCLLSQKFLFLGCYVPSCVGFCVCGAVIKKNWENNLVLRSRTAAGQNYRLWIWEKTMVWYSQQLLLLYLSSSFPLSRAHLSGSPNRTPFEVHPSQHARGFWRGLQVPQKDVISSGALICSASAWSGQDYELIPLDLDLCSTKGVNRGRAAGGKSDCEAAEQKVEMQHGCSKRMFSGDLSESRC